MSFVHGLLSGLPFWGGIERHLLVLVVIVPLLAAPVCALLRGSGRSWAWSTVITWATFALALALLAETVEQGVLVYELGDWPPPWGIEYRADVANAFVMVLVSGIGTIAMPYARQSVAKEIPDDRGYLFYMMYLLALTGLLGITITGDAFNLFVFLEISSLSTYVLISLGKDRRALTAAYRYLVMGTLGATFYVIGVGLMYMMTGTLNMADLSTILPAVSGTRTVLAAYAFIVVGLALKLAMFPLHTWLPNAYAYAPSVVTVFLAATATKVAVYAFLRLTYTVFGGTDIFEETHVREAIIGLALVGMFSGAAVAVFQRDIKRMLAYSSISQVGYMMLGFGLANTAGITATVVHLLNHGLMKGAAFMAMGCVVFVMGSARLKDMAGLGKRMPFTAAAFTVAGLSLIGTPITVGFISKFQLVEAALDLEFWLIAASVLLCSLLAIAYVWRVVEVMYFQAPAALPEGALAAAGAQDAGTVRREAPLGMLIPTWILVGVTVYFGIDGETTLDLAGAAAEALQGGR